MSKLEFLNKVILQWFFIRLCKHLKQDKEGDYTITYAYSIMYWVTPLSGWSSDYKSLGTIRNKIIYKP